MFKNRALQVQMVKKSKQKNVSDDTVECAHFDPEQINQIAKDQVKNIAVTVGAVVAGCKILNTVSEIAILAAKAKIQ